jgi:hypothetical protein
MSVFAMLPSVPAALLHWRYFSGADVGRRWLVLPVAVFQVVGEIKRLESVDKMHSV